MGRIAQVGDSLYLTPSERKSLNVTQWRFISPAKGRGGIEVCINYDVFQIKDLTMASFHELNHKNITVPKNYEFSRSVLACATCGGTGIVDWITKATKAGHSIASTCQRYIRDKGPVTILKTHLGRMVYASRQKLKRGDELCHVCHGCGVLTPQLILYGDQFIEEC